MRENLSSKHDRKCSFSESQMQLRDGALKISGIANEASSSEAGSSLLRVATVERRGTGGVSGLRFRD